MKTYIYNKVAENSPSNLEGQLGTAIRLASVLCTLCSVLLLSACTQDEIIAPQTPEAAVPQGMKTLTVDFQLPEGKPGFGEGETRATYTDGTWQSGDELMMRVTVQGFDDTKGYAVYKSYMTLAYDGTAWDVVEGKSATTLEVASTFITNPPYVMLAQTADIDLTQPLTIKVPEDMSMGEDGYVEVFLAYGPDMEWNLTPDANGAVTDVRYKAKATATTAAPELWEYSSGAWTTPQARLRISTGAAGDVVTLTSRNFHPNSVAKSADYTYTATTQADGYAYFYGKAGTMDDSDNMVALTSGFNVSLTGVTVGEGEAAVTCPVSPVTLLEASALVPVKLDAGESYWLDATAKRTAAADGIAVIDGTCGGKTTGDDTDVAAVKTAIAGKTTVYVTGASLAAYSSEGGTALTVVGEAICQLTLDDDGYFVYNSPNAGTISLVLPDAATIGEYAFWHCEALTSVSAPNATTIENCAFYKCSALKSVDLPETTAIGQNAFYQCSALTSLTFGKVMESVSEDAFSSTYNAEWTPNCSLTLHIDQLSSTDLAPSGNTWAGKTWASISYVDDEGNALDASKVVVIDGTSDDLETVKTAISGKSIIYVKGATLAADATGNIAATIVGEAISQLPSGTTISLVLPDVTEIGEYAFKDCTALTSVSAPAATSIEQSAFSGCKALTSVSASEATSIESFTFYNCSALESVSLPSAASIGNKAFAGCTALTNLTFGTVTSVNTESGYHSFEDATTENCHLTIGSGTTAGELDKENKTWAGKTWASITLK